jgi:hypothetical protein
MLIDRHNLRTACTCACGSRTLRRAGLHGLHARLGFRVEELELARVLRFDPRRRTVACVTAWVDGSERPVAYGAIDAGADAPDLLLADEERAPGVAAVLEDALRERSARTAAA